MCVTFEYAMFRFKTCTMHTALAIQHLDFKFAMYICKIKAKTNLIGCANDFVRC